MTGTKSEEQATRADGDVLAAAAAAAAEKKERVKARWAILRQALLGVQPLSSAVNIQHSMNSFAGFRVLDRVVIQDDDKEYSDLVAKCIVDEGGEEEEEEVSSSWDFVQNSYTSKNGEKIQFITREVRQHQLKQHQQCTSQSSLKSRVEALLSHRNHGVDNTGNVRVWDAEATLAGFLLSVLLGSDADLEATSDFTKVDDLKSRIKTALFENETGIVDYGQQTCNILELGAGQAGLAGLSVASATTSVDNLKPLHLLLTDGHPKCVKNNRSCEKLMQLGRNVTVHAQLLLWDSSAKGAEECQRINRESHNSTIEVDGQTLRDGSFHICLASDCLHFQDFHDALLATIARTLAVGGIALLCQPQRGSSLGNFMSMIDAVNAPQAIGDSAGSKCNQSSKQPLFHMTLIEDFYPKVSAMHKTLISDEAHANKQYDPNRHRPLLLVLRKLRHYDEEVHGHRVR